MKYFLLLISIFPVVNTEDNSCLYFNREKTSSINYCKINTAQNLAEIAYKRCLKCHIHSEHITLPNEQLPSECQNSLRCIEFEFYDDRLFELFFHNYSYLLKDLFNISNNTQYMNSLYIILKSNHFKEFNLEYIQSVLHSNGIYYSYLYFILSSYTKQILLDLETDLSKMPLIGIRIEIVCDKDIRNIYHISPPYQSAIQSNNCVTIQSNKKQIFPVKNNTTTSTKTSNASRKINIFLFIGGFIVFSIWILCLCLCLYLRYCKWKDNESSNQRSSIVSSMFSTDSYDSRKDDMLLPQQKNQYQLSEKANQRGLYSFDNEF